MSDAAQEQAARAEAHHAFGDVDALLVVTRGTSPAVVLLPLVAIGRGARALRLQISRIPLLLPTSSGMGEAVADKA